MIDVECAALHRSGLYGSPDFERTFCETRTDVHCHQCDERLGEQSTRLRADGLPAIEDARRSLEQRFPAFVRPSRT